MRIAKGSTGRVCLSPGCLDLQLQILECEVQLILFRPDYAQLLLSSLHLYGCLCTKSIAR